jgi:hypothetical protein
MNRPPENYPVYHTDTPDAVKISIEKSVRINNEQEAKTLTGDLGWVCFISIRTPEHVWTKIISFTFHESLEELGKNLPEMLSKALAEKDVRIKKYDELLGGA